jgi:alpha-ribazole phosphatase
MERAVAGRGPWRSVVSSPLKRCADFAHVLAERLNAPLTIDPRLREMDFGEWENCNSAELLQRDAAALTRFWTDPWNCPPPRGEALSAVRQRVLDAWRDVVALETPTLVITHGGPIRIILCHVLDHPIEKLMEIEVPYAALRRAHAPAKQDVS